MVESLGRIDGGPATELLIPSHSTGKVESGEYCIGLVRKARFMFAKVKLIGFSSLVSFPLKTELC